MRIQQQFNIERMLQKYTKFCTAQTLIKYIHAEVKDEQMLHVMLAVFAKPLAWIEQIYDHQGVYDSISKISVRVGDIKEELAWLFVIKGTVYYHQMPFCISEFIHFVGSPLNHIQSSENSICAVLTKDDVAYLNHKKEGRDYDKMIKFIKTNIFYPFYLEQQFVKEFAMLTRVKKLGFNKCLNWKDEDGSIKAGVIYKGVISVEYQWKRNIQICEITRGMFLTNHYIKDELQQVEDYQLEPIDQKPNDSHTYPKFKFVSKSEETIILIFNVHLISETPYNINPDLKKNIKAQFEKYTLILQGIIGNEDYNRLHRNKKSVKEQLRKKKEKDDMKKTINIQIQQKSMKSSPVLRTYVEQEKINPYLTITAMDLPPPPKQFSKAVFATIVNKSPHRLLRSKTTEAQRSYFSSSKKIIHNTWLEASRNKKRQNLKSFSTLVNLSTYRSQKFKSQHSLEVSSIQQNKPEFFVPDQFVKRKLRLKYQGLIEKMRHTNMTFRTQNEGSLAAKMQRLEEYVDSQRIVSVGTVKNKHKLLRDRVKY